MRIALALALVALTGCEPIPVSGAPLQPVRVAPAPSPVASAPTAAVLPPDASHFDFEGEDRKPSDAAGIEDDPLRLQAKLLGVSPDALAPRPAPALQVAPTQAVLPTAPQVWDPGKPPASGSWGVRLLATLVDVQPPRAVLGLQDGSEVVVQAGDFVDEARMVVLAIGRDAVQVAEVKPNGFYATVQTSTIRALFPRPGTGSE